MKLVYFNDGDGGLYLKDAYNFVRLVRSGQ